MIRIESWARYFGKKHALRMNPNIESIPADGLEALAKTANCRMSSSGRWF